MFASIDIETTGLSHTQHEIIQIGIMPLSRTLEPDGAPFYMNIRPDYPERSDPKAMQVNGLSLLELARYAPDSGRVIDSLVEWCDKNGNRRYPIAHNWEFEQRFLTEWIGLELLLELFRVDARDTMRAAAYINDRASLRGETPPFDKLTLNHVCSRLGVTNHNPHDALSDAIAGGEVYEKLLRMELV